MFICKNIYNLTIAVFRWEENMTHLLLISLSYDTKIVKIFIYFNYRNEFPWYKDLLYWENFEYQIDVLLSIINIAIVNTKFALRWNYIMKVISNRFRSVVSLTASCCVRQCWYIFSHIVKHMTTIHNNTMMRCMLTGYLNDINWISALYIYLLYMYQCVLSVPVQN